jgi:hypothetical protein
LRKETKLKEKKETHGSIEKQRKSEIGRAEPMEERTIQVEGAGGGGDERGGIGDTEMVNKRNKAIGEREEN